MLPITDRDADFTFADTLSARVVATRIENVTHASIVGVGEFDEFEVKGIDDGAHQVDEVLPIVNVVTADEQCEIDTQVLESETANTSQSSSRTKPRNAFSGFKMSSSRHRS